MESLKKKEKLIISKILKKLKFVMKKNDLSKQLRNIIKRKNLKKSISMENKILFERTNNLIFEKVLKGLN